MDIIHLLPDSVANQIAAGEVIQRPASCLKELVENSLDAGARHIRVIVRGAGRTLLQVVDDGKGMSPTDARMAFERHATSKIASAEDLFSLRTMGFRGEALASICAVAQVELQTRTAEDEVGVLLEIDGSRVVRQEMCQCAVGTSIKVKNLFYNVPVRRKFLKTDQTELRNLLQEFYHIVLVYPQVQFTFVSNDEVLMELLPGTEKQRIEAVFGKGSGRSFTGNLVDVRTDTELVSVRGFVGKPESAGKSAQQYFFVNGRYMRHPYFHKAILTAYAGMLPGEYAPSYFIYFDINPEAIDVNVHPTKTEIKFADEQAIFQILLAAVREALGKFDIAPSLDFNRSGEIEMPMMERQPASVSTPHVVVDPNYNPFRPTSPASGSYEPFARQSVETNRRVTGWETLYQIPADDELQLFDVDLEAVVPYQYAGRYILLPSRNGLMMVNQHRAHYSVLYEQYMSQETDVPAQMQQLLFEEVLELSPDRMALMSSIRDDLRTMGFEMEQLSRTSYSITGVPALLGTRSALPVLQNILHSVAETQASVRSEWRRAMALSLSKDTAIPYGRGLTETEMRELLTKLFNLSSFLVSPDGKKIVSVLTDDEIGKRF